MVMFTVLLVTLLLHVFDINGGRRLSCGDAGVLIKSGLTYQNDQNNEKRSAEKRWSELHYQVKTEIKHPAQSEQIAQRYEAESAVMV